MTPLQDPRVRQTWNNIQHNAETATESAAVGIWTFTHEYINPCLASISNSFEQCTDRCFPDRDERIRRLRERVRTRGRAEYSFDFYDDWDEEEENASGGLLGWGNDELDRLLAGSGSTSQGPIDDQPSGRRRGMSYGTRSRGSRRMNAVDGLTDPSVIPSTNSLGFLHKLPFKIGGTLRYKPSAADLQENLGTHRTESGNEEALFIDDDGGEDGAGDFDMTRTRARSSTTGSGNTSDSFRSRGDLFPSDGEDDAVPISDEFAMVLERRTTGSSGALDDRGSGKTRSSKGKRPSASRGASRTVSKSSDASRPSFGMKKGSSTSTALVQDSITGNADAASLTALQQEEQLMQKEEDTEIERKREAAARLASERGLTIPKESPSEFKQEPTVVDVIPPLSEVTMATKQEDISEVKLSREHIGTASHNEDLRDAPTEHHKDEPKENPRHDFIPARLPNFE